MGDWQLDPYHTQVEFAAKHLGMMTVRGHFAEVSSVAGIDPDHPEASSVEVTIQAASIRTAPTTRRGTTTCARRTSSRPTSSRR
jgi:polyisoprenoid-binding protein YceI